MPQLEFVKGTTLQSGFLPGLGRRAACPFVFMAHIPDLCLILLTACTLFAEPSERLLTDLRSPDPMTRVRASMVLGRIGESAVPALIEALRDPKWETRIAAANALRDMKSAGAAAAPALAENLSYSADGQLGYPPKEASLYAGSPSLQVRWAVVTALGHIGPRAISAVPVLLATLAGEHESGLAGPKPGYLYGEKHSRIYEMRGAGAWVIQKIGPAAARQHPQVIPALAAALKDSSRMVRLNAAMALKAMGPLAEKAVPALLEALQHPDQYTRIYAALAFSGLGRIAAAHVPALVECHNSIRLDDLARGKIRDVIFQISGSRPKLRADPTPPLQKQWAGLDRQDFFLVVQPFLDSSLLIDPDKLVDAFLKARMGNAISYWPDHVWYNIPPPTASQLQHWGVGMLWYFFTEDTFNPKLQRDWSFATVDDYNLDLIDQIAETGKMLGKDRALWAVGHEQMDQVRGWAFQEDGTKQPPVFQSKHDGYEFYRKWITTTLHTRHWMEYGNTRPSKFFDGWNTGAKATWEFLADHKIDTTPVTMLSGGVSASLAHASFDILPQIGMYWWECQIDGASLQVGAAYASGAARQYGKKWLMDVSPWSPVHGSPGWGYVDGKWSGGTTDETQLRSWLYGYLSGAAAVLEESSGSTHFRIDPYPDGPSDRPVVTSTGKTAQRAARFCFELCPDRGESYRPVAVLLEHEHGFEPRPRTNFRLHGPWGYMPMGEGEYEIEKFWYAAFPGHSTRPDKSKVGPDSNPREVEPLILTESTFGDAFDVITDRASQETLSRYPRLLTVGGIQIGSTLLPRLRKYIEQGGELFVNAAHLRPEAEQERLFGVQFGSWTDSRDPSGEFAVNLRELKPTRAEVIRRSADGKPLLTRNSLGNGKVYVMAARHNLAGRAPSADSQWLPATTDFLKQWISPVWPLEVVTRNGHAPQVLLNKLGDGWLVALGNHWGDEWRGTVRFLSGTTEIESLTEVWSQSRVDCVAQEGGCAFDATAPPYDFSVYRLKTHRR